MSRGLGDLTLDWGTGSEGYLRSINNCFVGNWTASSLSGQILFMDLIMELIEHYFRLVKLTMSGLGESNSSNTDKSNNNSKLSSKGTQSLSMKTST